MTDEGREALDRGCARDGYSRPDYIEKLVLAEDKRRANWKNQFASAQDSG